jgi:hypothetical protein
MMELYLHAPICLHGVVLNLWSTETTLQNIVSLSLSHSNAIIEDVFVNETLASGELFWFKKQELLEVWKELLNDKFINTVFFFKYFYTNEATTVKT